MPHRRAIGTAGRADRRRGAIVAVGLMTTILACTGSVGPSGLASASAPSLELVPTTTPVVTGSPASTASPTATAVATPTAAWSWADVPSEIRERPWAFDGPDGVIGGPSLDRLRVLSPGRELPLQVFDDAVLTTTIKSVLPNQLRMRDLSSGEILAEIETTKTFVSAARFGDRVLLTGWDNQNDDPGVSAFNIKSRKLVEIIASQPTVSKFPSGGWRSIFVSPTGRTVISELCGNFVGECTLESIDVGARSVRPIGSIDAFIRYVTDDVAIGAPDFPDRLIAFSLATGKRAWSRKDLEVQFGYLTSDGRLVQSYIDHRDKYMYTVAIIDPGDGSEEVAYTAEVTVHRRVWETLSTGSYLVFADGSPNELLGSDERAVASILDLRTGQVDEDAFLLEVAP